MPIVGKKWCHEGVTKFFQNIAKNEYQILYLTARAIGQVKNIQNINKIKYCSNKVPTNQGIFK